MQPTKTARIVALCIAVMAVGYGLYRAGLLRGIGTWGVFLLCPLMHVVMMLVMGRGCHGHAESPSPNDSASTEGGSDRPLSQSHTG